MTKDEFRDYVDFLRSQNEISYDVYSGLIDGIDTLGQELCNDCISRQEVLSEIETVCFSKEWIKFRLDNGSNGERDYIINYIKELPPVQPELFINKPCVSEQACREDKIKVLGKIKKEIEAKCCITVGRECDGAITLRDIFEIIDKYKSESET